MSSRYQQQLQEKIQRIQALFNNFVMPEMQVFASPEQHFRMRAEFRIWHQHDDLFYAMFERDDANSKNVIRIDEFPIASASINQLMPQLLVALKAQPMLSNRLFEVHFLATLHGDMLVTLIYHRKLEAEWEDAAKQLAATLNIKIMGRSRGQKFIIGDDYVIERLEVNHQTFEYKQGSRLAEIRV